jgi:hypothetical protein
VSQIIDAVSRLAENQIPLKVFPIGIPAPDGLGVHVTFDRGNLEVLAKILGEETLLQNIDVFPLGIPIPDVFQATFNFR